MTDAQISKLLGTTKATIDAVRNRSHWNAANLKPVDPVSLGLSTQLELDALVKKAAEKRAKEDAKKGIVDDGASLQPAAQHEEPAAVEPEEEKRGPEPTAASVFGANAASANEDDDED